MAWRDRWRALLLKARAPTVRDAPTVSPFDEFPALAASREHSPFRSLLDDIEATALAIYAAHDLPAQHGHYARHPQTGVWIFIGEHLTPQERFAIVEANPPEDGWRFGNLQNLGLESENALLSAAGALLEGVSAMRSCQTGSTTEDDLHAAIRLGEAWRSVRGESTPVSSRLVLTAPEDDVAGAASPGSG